MIIMETILYIVFTKDNKHFYTFTNKDNAVNRCLELGMNMNSIIEYDEDKVNDILKDDKLFNKLNKADFDSQDHDYLKSKNGYNRLIRNLKKVGLSLQEWNIWCTL